MKAITFNKFEEITSSGTLRGDIPL